jgi:hypothetical protein
LQTQTPELPTLFLKLHHYSFYLRASIKFSEVKGIFENKYAYFRIGNGIVTIQAKSDVVLNLDMATAITFARISLQNQKVLPVCFEMSGIKDCDKTGRDFLAKFGWAFAQKVAIHTANSRSTLIARYYQKISKPIVTTRLFFNEEQAMAFLHNHQH